MIKSIILIGFGGAIGSILRYMLGIFIKQLLPITFPLSTFIINIIGCLLIGILYGFSEKNNLIDSNINSFLIVGFCGGFTTFSTFANENFNLLQNNNFILSLIYTLCSVGLGILAVRIGYKIFV